jgi:hypothetical protein
VEAVDETVAIAEGKGHTGKEPKHGRD